MELTAHSTDQGLVELGAARLGLPPDLALRLLGQLIVILRPQASAKVFPASVRQQAHNVSRIHALRLFDGTVDH